ncbi:Glycosyltransferase involved in cell wall bisynthesis [Alkalibacterium subtropicum]|uniref:Glycosyltransferase involved in cell wall bisynthesis n=1 Tax=Alkalibacterium subtropicum TaxID=753702 RepID=A0A1I1GIJ5_9LACT|nr:glycosyltransferase family 2 protein [Alkalibacterium subtropicum]SFC11072.1 Glycosyltransferase involved in cell wall bisynthesis [Alkalibacterium subtropicum]
MKDEKLVSVVMPIYNAEEFLRDNLDSIKKQTYANLEVLLVDDGSTDGSAQIAQAFCLNDPRFSYYLQQNQGAPAARNHGFRESHGKYVMFVDSDDVLKEDGIERLYRVAQKQQADLVIGQYDTIDETGKPLEFKKMAFTKDGIFDASSSLERLFFFSPVPGNKLYNAELLREKDLYFSDLKRAQDLNFYLKFLSYADKVCTTSDTTYLYRIRANSISHTVSPVILETIRSLNDVEAFYRQAGRYSKKLFSSLKFKYYSDQLSKIPQIEDRTERQETYQRLAAELKAIRKNDLLPAFRKTKYRKVKTKLLFPFLYKSRLYSSLQTRRLERKKRKR